MPCFSIFKSTAEVKYLNREREHYYSAGVHWFKVAGGVFESFTTDQLKHGDVTYKRALVKQIAKAESATGQPLTRARTMPKGCFGIGKVEGGDTFHMGFGVRLDNKWMALPAHVLLKVLDAIEEERTIAYGAEVIDQGPLWDFRWCTAQLADFKKYRALLGKDLCSLELTNGDVAFVPIDPNVASAMHLGICKVGEMKAQVRPGHVTALVREGRGLMNSTGRVDYFSNKLGLFYHQASTEDGSSGCPLMNGTKFVGFHLGSSSMKGLNTAMTAEALMFRYRQLTTISLWRTPTVKAKSEGGGENNTSPTENDSFDDGEADEEDLARLRGMTLEHAVQEATDDFQPFHDSRVDKYKDLDENPNDPDDEKKNQESRKGPGYGECGKRKPKGECGDAGPSARRVPLPDFKPRRTGVEVDEPLPPPPPPKFGRIAPPPPPGLELVRPDEPEDSEQHLTEPEEGGKSSEEELPMPLAPPEEEDSAMQSTTDEESENECDKVPTYVKKTRCWKPVARGQAGVTETGQDGFDKVAAELCDHFENKRYKQFAGSLTKLPKISKSDLLVEFVRECPSFAPMANYTYWTQSTRRLDPKTDNDCILKSNYWRSHWVPFRESSHLPVEDQNFLMRHGIAPSYGIPGKGESCMTSSIKAQWEKRPNGAKGGEPYHPAVYERMAKLFKPVADIDFDESFKRAVANQDLTKSPQWTKFEFGNSKAEIFNKQMPQFQELVGLRLILQAIVGEYYDRGLPFCTEDCLAIGLVDPRCCFIKDEVTPLKKIDNGYARVIHGCSLLDAICEEIVNYSFNKQIMRDFHEKMRYEVPPDGVGLGIGHHDDGHLAMACFMNRTRKRYTEADRMWTSTDLSSFDITVDTQDYEMECFVRTQCHLAGGNDYGRFLACVQIGFNMCSASANALLLGHELWVMPIGNMTSSGVPSTAARQTLIRRSLDMEIEEEAMSEKYANWHSTRCKATVASRLVEMPDIVVGDDDGAYTTEAQRKVTQRVMDKHAKVLKEANHDKRRLYLTSHVYEHQGSGRVTAQYANLPKLIHNVAVQGKPKWEQIKSWGDVLRHNSEEDQALLSHAISYAQSKERLVVCGETDKWVE